MHTITDYQVLSGNQGFFINASTNDNREDLFFDLPENFVRGTNKARMIMTFNARPFEDTRVLVQMTEANNEVFNIDLNESHTRGLSYIISPTDAFPDGQSFDDNVRVRFRAVSGRIQISKVVLWYQIRI
ncbi:MAG: hypothetical protein AB4372_15650 [Xenococcus sp. (in: cyanobacteria)]